MASMDNIRINITARVNTDQIALDSLIGSLDRLTQMQTQFSGLSSALDSLATALSRVGQVGSSVTLSRAAENIRTLSQAAGVASTNATTVAAQQTPTVGDNTPVAVNPQPVPVGEMEQLADAAEQTEKSTDQTAKNMKETEKGTKGAANSLYNILGALKRVAIYRLIRGVIKSITEALSTGLKRVYEYSTQKGTEFAKNMDRMASSWNYVKSALGAMIEPLVNIFAPVIEKIVDWFVDLVNYINQMISALSGATSWTKAIKTDIKYGADNAKELKRQLIGIDELNVLNGDSSKNDLGSYKYVTEAFDEATLKGEGFLGALRKWGAEIKRFWETYIEPLALKIRGLFDGKDSPGQKMLDSLGEVITSANQALKDIGKVFGLDNPQNVVNAFGQIANAISGLLTIAKGANEIISGIFSFDGSKILTGIWDIVQGIVKACWAMASGIRWVFVSLINLLVDFIAKMPGGDWAKGLHLNPEMPYSWEEIEAFMTKGKIPGTSTAPVNAVDHSPFEGYDASRWDSGDWLRTGDQTFNINMDGVRVGTLVSSQNNSTAARYGSKLTRGTTV